MASPRPLSFFAKQELFSNPLFSALIRRLGAFPVDRGSGDQAAMERALELLKNGHALVIFPEGTRTTTGQLGKLRFGAALMAVRAGVPIVPVWIEGSFAAWPKRGPLRRAPVRVQIGAPIFPSGYANTARGFKAMTGAFEERLRALSSKQSDEPLAITKAIAVAEDNASAPDIS